FFFGVFELPRRGFEVSTRLARHHFDVFSAEPARRAAAVHRRVSDADDEHALADLVGVPEGNRFEPVDPDMNARAVVPTGDLQVLATRRAAAHENGVEAVLEEPLHAGDRVVVFYLDVAH